MQGSGVASAVSMGASKPGWDYELEDAIVAVLEEEERLLRGDGIEWVRADIESDPSAVAALKEVDEDARYVEQGMAGCGGDD